MANQESAAGWHALTEEVLSAGGQGVALDGKAQSTGGARSRPAAVPLERTWREQGATKQAVY